MRDDTTYVLSPYDHPEIQNALQQAMRAQQRGAYEEATSIIGRALTRFPQSPHLYNALGMGALAQADPSAALESFERASELDPREPTLHIERR
ncbi:hypothetical protein AB5I41_23180 [Sphingomonas sp. MMS24-JH45]